MRLNAFEPQLEVVPDARELARVEPRASSISMISRVGLDRRPVEAVGDPPREEAHLEEVHEALEPRVLARGADGHLQLAAAAAHEELGQVVELHPLLGQHPVEQILDARVLGAERLLEPLAQGLEVQEVEVEEPSNVGWSRNSLISVAASVDLNASRSASPTSALAASASSASEGETRISARRRSPMKLEDPLVHD